MIKHLYGDGAKGTKLLTMCNLWVSKSDIRKIDTIWTNQYEICKECKEEQEKRDKLDV